jgi:hypothetical protein
LRALAFFRTVFFLAFRVLRVAVRRLAGAFFFAGFLFAAFFFAGFLFAVFFLADFFFAAFFLAVFLFALWVLRAAVLPLAGALFLAAFFLAVFLFAAFFFAGFLFAAFFLTAFFFAARAGFPFFALLAREGFGLAALGFLALAPPFLAGAAAFFFDLEPAEAAFDAGGLRRDSEAAGTLGVVISGGITMSPSAPWAATGRAAGGVVGTVTSSVIGIPLGRQRPIR